MSIKKNDEIRLKITALTSQGSGIGRYNDMAVFVEDSAVGDDLLVHVIKVKKNYAVGIIKKIYKSSPDRVESDCEAFGKCGGCSYRHISYEAEKREKKQFVTDAMNRIGGIDVKTENIYTVKNPDRYRNKAQIPVGLGKDGQLITGFYSKRSHRIVPCDDCLLQMPDFKDIVAAVRKYILENPVSVYDEETGKGLIRHIYLRQGRKTGQIMVCLVINGDTLPKKERFIESVLSVNGNIKSIVLNINKADTNVILGEKCVTLWGEDFIEDELCGLTFRISPLSFYQVNPEGTEILYGKAKEYACLKGNETLLDLYCGTGTIGLTMAKYCKELIGVEIIPQAIENAKKNASLNGIENSRFICDDAAGAAKTLFEEGIRPDVIILDPPRKGCSADVIDTVVSMAPERVVYVSCDPATLARDCRIFDDKGYKVTELCAVDMFPRTVHVETVVQLVRKNPDTHIDFEISLDEFDLTASEAKAT
ncbi:MAG: 23S rRNA (uracil(1939)-C(5))-methyltransferase RlmD [Clostridia bacterium]|nr:23S rRNA (uracil(1939)-C(5))-methyltransferase RlmD [Clostridia bacterium]